MPLKHKKKSVVIKDNATQVRESPRSSTLMQPTGPEQVILTSLIYESIIYPTARNRWVTIYHWKAASWARKTISCPEISKRVNTASPTKHKILCSCFPSTDFSRQYSYWLGSDSSTSSMWRSVLISALNFVHIFDRIIELISFSFVSAFFFANCN